MDCLLWQCRHVRTRVSGSFHCCDSLLRHNHASSNSSNSRSTSDCWEGVGWHRSHLADTVVAVVVLGIHRSHHGLDLVLDNCSCRIHGRVHGLVHVLCRHVHPVADTLETGTVDTAVEAADIAAEVLEVLDNTSAVAAHADMLALRVVLEVLDKEEVLLVLRWLGGHSVGL